MNLHEATENGRAFLALLGGTVAQAALAGSIRRNKPEVKDIEIVVEPQFRHLPNLFGEATTQASLLDERIGALLADGTLALDTLHKRNGPKYRRYRHRDAPEIVFEVFVADSLNWGNILAIRTGNADFSRALVTKRLHGGLMPSDLAQRDGRLWRGREALDCWTEEEFFAHLRIAEADIPPPIRRTEETARQLARKAVAA